VIKKWLLLLKQFGRRIKENMEIIGVTLATIFIPTGYYLLVTGREYNDGIMILTGGFMTIGGLLCLLKTWKDVLKKEKQENESRDKLNRTLDAIYTALIKDKEDKPKQDGEQG